MPLALEAPSAVVVRPPLPRALIGIAAMAFEARADRVVTVQGTLISRWLQFPRLLLSCYGSYRSVFRTQRQPLMHVQANASEQGDHGYLHSSTSLVHSPGRS